MSSKEGGQMTRNAIFAIAVTALACNSAPAALQVSITPGSPTTSDDLAAEISGELVDPDGDEVSTSFTWYQDDEARPDLTELTVPAELTAKGQRWKLFVLPSDGKLDGPPSEAEILVLNTPPVVDSVTLEPTVPLTSEDVVASVEASDADEDPVDVSYSWQLDGAGTGYTEATLPASATARGDVWTLHVIPSDDEESGDELLASVSIDNTAPVVVSVTLAPQDPQEGDTIIATAATEDEDGDPVSLLYSWTADDALVLEGEYPSLSDDYFAKGQQISVEVIPNDGFVDGTSVTSDAVTVLNTVPSCDSAAVDQDEVYEASLLSCLGVGWDDPDGDPESYQVTWYVNGAEVESVLCSDSSEDCLDGAAFDKGQNVSCAVVPDDGEDLGVAVLSETVTVLNSAPVISDAVLSSTSPVEGDSISVSIAASDDDGDTISYGYAWFVNGVQVSTAETIDSNLFDKHQSIYVELTPHDGRVDGTTVTSNTASAVNTPPEIVTLDLDPSELYTDDEVSAAVSTADADGDDVSLSYAWTVDGADPGVTSSSLPGSAYFDKHQTVAVTVTPNDGEEDGLQATTSVEVLNSPPTAPELSTEPVYPEAMVDDIVCSIGTGSTDADGDSISYSFTWDVDGVPYLAGGGADTGDTASGWLGAITATEPGDTVPGEDTRDNQTWTCSVTPNDGADDGPVAEVTTVSRFLIAPQVHCGHSHTCLLDQGGQLTCWGMNGSGQSTPPSGDFSYVAVANDAWSCAIDDEGSIECWGDTADGRDSVPTGSFVQLDGGNQFMLALDDSGQVHCWGPDSSGGCRDTPSGMASVSAGENGVCGITTAGEIDCWGHVYSAASYPSGLFTQVAYAWRHACALDSSGTIHCWGDDDDGEATPPSGTFCAVDVGHAHSCAMDCSGHIQCWGIEGTTTAPSGSFIQMCVGNYYGCAVDNAGLVQCWEGTPYGAATPPSSIAGP
jgi:hypothetical protein